MEYRKILNKFVQHLQLIIFISVIELASGEYGSDVIEKMVDNADNGRRISYMKDSVISNNTQQNTNTLNGKQICFMFHQ